MLKKPKKMKWNSKQVKRDLLTAYCRITWKIWVYLKANPYYLVSFKGLRLQHLIRQPSAATFPRWGRQITFKLQLKKAEFLRKSKQKYSLYSRKLKI